MCKHSNSRTATAHSTNMQGGMGTCCMAIQLPYKSCMKIVFLYTVLMCRVMGASTFGYHTATVWLLYSSHMAPVHILFGYDTATKYSTNMQGSGGIPV